ncbi:MAG: NAD(P)/FAD-dependent oxidoreductase [Acidobacteriaceae bacterium]
MRRRAIIIGAGPAGLTAALELLRRTDILPIVLEASEEIGGISRTIRYKGNRMDIGGHRFFSKSDRVMQWWMDLMPPQMEPGETAGLTYQGRQRVIAVPSHLPQEPVLRGAGPLSATRRVGEGRPAEALQTSPRSSTSAVAVPTDPDLVMLIRPRKSRIYYLRRFFDYPIRITAATLSNLGLLRTLRVGLSYLRSRIHKITPEKSLEDFLINRFGRELYLTFFKSYTEKVWGTPCERISAEWGAQRIKGLSLTTAVRHFLRGIFSRRPAPDLAQKNTDTSLIERFLYPKLGPGQLWEHVADLIRAAGGEIHTGCRVVGVAWDGSASIQAGQTPSPAGPRVSSVTVSRGSGTQQTFTGDFFVSTMAIKDLLRAMEPPAPHPICDISEGLEYRDFITVGLLVDRLRVKEEDGGSLKDTWIYVQEPDVLLGRLQIFNNWSPHLVADPNKVWIGLEYFCYETDDLWKMADAELQRFAVAEAAKIGILDPEDVLDGHVVRVPKTYPAYFGTYDRFEELRAYIDTFENLLLIGRNGMHKYNNQDHSMLTAMTAVDGIAAGHIDKAALWSINTEQEYHEAKKEAS